MKKWIFKPVNRKTPDMFPPFVEDYIDQNHQTRFIVEVIDQLDIEPFIRTYRSSGSKA
jgi:transposase